MNLSQIERKFKELETKENYVRYFYNPAANKVAGVRQHPYISELQRDYEQDVEQYGMDPFIKMKQQQTLETAATSSANAYAKHEPPKTKKSTVFNEAPKDPLARLKLGDKNTRLTSLGSMLQGTTQSPKEEVAHTARDEDNPRAKMLSRRQLDQQLRPRTQGGMGGRTRKAGISATAFFISKPKNIIEQCDQQHARKLSQAFSVASGNTLLSAVKPISQQTQNRARMANKQQQHSMNFQNVVQSTTFIH